MIMLAHGKRATRAVSHPGYEPLRVIVNRHHVATDTGDLGDLPINPRRVYRERGVTAIKGGTGDAVIGVSEPRGNKVSAGNLGQLLLLSIPSEVPLFWTVQRHGIEQTRRVKRGAIGLLATAWLATNNAAFLVLGDLRKLGLPRPSKGAATRQIEDNQVPSLDDGFIASVKKGLFSFVPEISAFTTEGVELVDGQTLNPDVIICATGYRLGLQELVGTMKVLNIKGVPTFLADESCSAHPGLWFFGLNTSLFGNFYIRRSESKRLAEKIKRQLEK